MYIGLHLVFLLLTHSLLDLNVHRTTEEHLETDVWRTLTIEYIIRDLWQKNLFQRVCTIYSERELKKDGFIIF